MFPENFFDKVKYFEDNPNRWNGGSSSEIYLMLEGYCQDLWEMHYKGWTREHLKQMIVILDGEIDEGYE